MVMVNTQPQGKPVKTLTEVQTVFGLLRSRISLARARRRKYNSTLAELRGLSDRDLRDIGLVRRDIKRIAREAAEGI